MASDWLLRTRPTAATDVKTYSSAYELYPDMLAALRTATQAGHFIYLLGWHVQIDELMPLDKPGGSSSSCLREVLKAADAKGVQIRAMFDMDIQVKRNKENGAAVDFINSLGNGAAVLDSRVLQFGSHHQKVLAVSGSQGIIAFVGGWDIHPHRWNWLDVHCRLAGGAAVQVVELFHQRWMDHSAVMLKPKQKQVLPALKSGQTGKTGSDPGKEVQIVRTYGNAPARGGLNWRSPVIGIGPDTYDFAKAGEFTTYALILSAIKRATKFIYCEDQYLFASEMRRLPDIREVLATQLASVRELKFIALINRTEDINAEVKQAWHYRRLFIERIKSGNPGKVFVFQYKKGDNPFIHSKTWVFDDEFAIIGSANCNRRGYSYDSEVAAGIAGQNANGNTFAFDLRVKLWLSRLNPSGGKPPTVKPEDVHGWQDGLKLMLNPASRFQPYYENGGVDSNFGALGLIRGPESVEGKVLWDVIDPDGS